MDLPDGIESLRVHGKWNTAYAGASLLCWMELYSQNMIGYSAKSFTDLREVANVIGMDALNLRYMEMAFLGVGRLLHGDGQDHCTDKRCVLCAALRSLTWARKRLWTLAKDIDRHDAKSIAATCHAAGHALSVTSNPKLQAFAKKYGARRSS